jgi:hypothetical protein
MNEQVPEEARSFVVALLTNDVLEMQLLLFRPDHGPKRGIECLTMWRILEMLRAEAQLDPFRMWLVGSRLERENSRSDIDIVLAPRNGLLPDATIDAALWHCRHYGLYRAAIRCLIDPVFRREGPCLTDRPLDPDLMLTSTKLASPQFVNYVLTQQIANYRRVGRWSLEYARSAGDSSFYIKLPRRHVQGEWLPYLRPAVEIV